MKKLVVILAMVFGLAAAVTAESVYVGEEKEMVGYQTIVETFVSYDTDFDWSSIEGAEEGSLWDFYILEEHFNMHFEVGTTYTFHIRNSDQKAAGVLTFQRLTEDTEGKKDGNWVYVLTYTEE